MKKIELFIITIMILLILPLIVNASSFTNECSNYSSGDCAFCVYEFYNNGKKDYKINVALIYKSDSNIIEHREDIENLNSIYNYGIRVQYDGDFYKDDFKNGGVVKCPDIGYESLTNTDKNFNGQVFKISKDGINQMNSTSESKITISTENDDDNDNDNETKIVCNYDNFKVGITNGNLKVILNYFSNKKIKENLDSTLFKNGNCPSIYTCTYDNVNYVTYTTYYNSSSANYCYEHEGVSTNANTGESIIQPSINGKIDYKNICGEEEIKNAMQIIGYVINLAKIIVPLIIIILGMVDFGKATISSDDKAISKAASSLVRRFVAGVIIFFIPTIVFALLNLLEVSNENNESGSFVECTKCMLKPNSECD